MQQLCFLWLIIEEDIILQASICICDKLEFIGQMKVHIIRLPPWGRLLPKAGGEG